MQERLLWKVTGRLFLVWGALPSPAPSSASSPSSSSSSVESSVKAPVDSQSVLLSKQSFVRLILIRLTLDSTHSIPIALSPAKVTFSIASSSYTRSPSGFLSLLLFTINLILENGLVILTLCGSCWFWAGPILNRAGVFDSKLSYDSGFMLYIGDITDDHRLFRCMNNLRYAILTQAGHSMLTFDWVPRIFWLSLSISLSNSILESQSRHLSFRAVLSPWHPSSMIIWLTFHMPPGSN